MCGNNICEAESTLEVTESGASTHRQVLQPFATGSVSLSIPMLQHDDVLERCEAANSCCYATRRWRVITAVSTPMKRNGAGGSRAKINASGTSAINSHLSVSHHTFRIHQIKSCRNLVSQKPTTSDTGLPGFSSSCTPSSSFR